MYYFIDSADVQQIEDACSLGVCGITANPSMYRKQQTSIIEFVKRYAKSDYRFLSGEVLGTYEDMLKQAEQLLAIKKDIVIKINFSKEGLRLLNTLHKRGVTTAMTLVFTMAQANAAINAGCDYLFFFIGRNEEEGNDGLQIISNIQRMIDAQGYATKIVAASIKNLYQLEKLAEAWIPYAAIPYDLLIKSLHHPLSDRGAKTFLEDYNISKAPL